MSESTEGTQSDDLGAAGPEGAGVVPVGGVGDADLATGGVEDAADTGGAEQLDDETAGLAGTGDLEGAG